MNELLPSSTHSPSPVPPKQSRRPLATRRSSRSADFADNLHWILVAVAVVLLALAVTAILITPLNEGEDAPDNVPPTDEIVSVYRD